MEVYNGKEKHPGQEKDYHAKIQGYFLKENIEKLNKHIAKESLTIHLKCYNKTSKFEGIVAEGFQYEKSNSENSSPSS